MQHYSKILFLSSSLLLAACILVLGNFFEQLSEPGLWFGLFWLLVLNTLIFSFNVKMFGNPQKDKPHSSGILWSVDGALGAFGLLSFMTVIYFLWTDIDGYYSSFYFWMVQLIIITITSSIIAVLSLSLKLAVGNSETSVKKESLVNDAELLCHHLGNRFGIQNEELTVFTNTIRFRLPHPSRLDQEELVFFAVELKNLVQKALSDDYDSSSMQKDLESLQGKLSLLVGNSS